MSIDRAQEIADYLERVDRVTEAGGTVGERFSTIRKGWNALALPSKPEAALLAAVIENDTDKMDAALAIASAEASGARLKLRQIVSTGIVRELLAAYRETARPNYDMAVQRFDEAAAKLVKVATPEVRRTPESALPSPQTPQQARVAWYEAVDVSRELEGTFALLIDAARLAGVQVEQGVGSVVMPAQIPLAVETDGHHRRRLWEAFANRDHHFSRWGALLDLGVTLRALPAGELRNHQPYREPREMELRTERVNGGYRQYHVDPEDAGYRPAEAEPSAWETERAERNRQAWDAMEERAEKREQA